MLEESRSLIAEADELRDFLESLRPEDWRRPTPFKSWTPWDVVAHLNLGDRLALLALNDPLGFAASLGELMSQIAAGVSPTERARRTLGDLAPEALLLLWHETCRDLAGQLDACDPGRRVPWVGRDMGLRSFAAARLMETWAHGQDIYDLMGVPKTHSDRIRPIAEMGVRTFGWTFSNRGLDVPAPPPHVRLEAPSGAIWRWNEPSADNRVAGQAVEFCQVVTQVRNVADTALEVSGETARRWMAVAQCFAGPPEDPPRPGQRLSGGHRLEA
jgi:uncharacterized protein (TIGR03084 family)